MTTPPESMTEQEPSAVPFVLPLILCLVIGMFAPSFESADQTELGDDLSAEVQDEMDTYISERNAQNARNYTWLVMAQVVLGTAIVCYCFPVYRRQFPVKISVWGPLVGLVGVVLWVAICKLGLESTIFQVIGVDQWMPKRVSFNPMSLESSYDRSLFLAFRFFLLAALIPVAEELFLRGWLIRYFDSEQWWSVSLVQLSLRSCAAATVYGVLTHPAEFLAAVVWFSLVTWMMKATGRFWDCVVAHAVTNLLLGCWVMWSGDWFLW